jgi:hypothetical protein
VAVRGDAVPAAGCSRAEAAAKALAVGIPVFNEPSDAAVALAAVREVEEFARKNLA